MNSTKLAIEIATNKANEKANALAKSNTNGSEAWQAVTIDADGRTAVGKELKALGVYKSPYWGYTVTPYGFNDYFQEEAWTTEFAKALNTMGISAHRVERLL